MKFSFISVSPNDGIDAREGRKSIATFPPLSILYLASVFEEIGVEVSVLDQPALGLTVEETLRWVAKENPDVTTVFGNHHATFNAERILRRYPSVDIASRGEGEKNCCRISKLPKKRRRPKESSGNQLPKRRKYGFYA